MKTREIDPVGRETVYVYGTNNVPDPDPATGSGLDLLEVRVKNAASPGGWDVTAQSTYNDKHEPLTTTDAAGQITTYTYDAQDRVETVTTPPRAGITEDRTTTYTYDPVTGAVANVTAPGSVTSSSTYDVYGRVRTTTDNDNYTLTYDYDAFDRPTKVTYPDGTYEETTYERLDPAHRRDRLGRWSHRFYDPLRRVVMTRDPAGRTVTQQWCSCGSLDKLIGANGNPTTWERDIQNRVTREVRANGSAKQFTYETTTSRLKQVTDAKLQEIHYTYGIDDQLLQTTYVNAEHPTPNVTLNYTDPATNAPDAHGRLRQMTDGTGTTTYTFVPITGGVTLGAGQLASVDGPLSDDTISYGYDEVGRIVSRTLNGITSSWVFDQQDRLQSQGDPIGTFTWAYVSNSGRVQSVTYPNGQSTSYTYYPVAQDLRLQEIHHKKPDTTTLNRFTYTYDAIGNIRTWTQQTDASAANAYDFGYDRADELTLATYRTTDPNPTILKRYRYAYDPTGNRTAEQVDDVVTGASYDNMNRLSTQQPGGALLFGGTLSEAATVTLGSQPAVVSSTNAFSGTVPVASGTSQVAVQARDYSGNVRTNTYEVTQAGAAKTFNYDANGNLIGDGSRTYEWDAENRLITVKQGGTSLASFTYDGRGRRSTKVAGGVTTTYVYDSAQFLEERPSSASTKRYVYGIGIDRPLAQIVGGTTTYNVADHLGSLVRTTDSLGAAALARQYDPWGKPIQGSSTSGYAFTGREWDAESGLYYYRARYYDANVARFISVDPASSALAAYSYGRQNPLSFEDPSGLAECHYSIVKHHLCCQSNAGDRKAEIDSDYVHSGFGVCMNNPACTGIENEGPVPPGTYKMVPEYKARWNIGGPGAGHNAWRLKPTIATRIAQSRIKRAGGYFLHLGHISEGCITVSIVIGAAIQQWAPVDTMLNAENPKNTMIVRE